ncbi:MAG: carbohydrate ABC transporter permease [Clostridiaceae bacterium]|jgi:putative aldouronate transport system permease protein|nr:carbohydrate ABC transporter permease [Clostridiaceae bacterium]
MKKSTDQVVFLAISYIVTSLIAIFTLFPFVVLIVNSFASEHSIIFYGYSLFPKEFSVDAYDLIFRSPDTILRSYGVTMLITTLGTATSLFFSSMAAYVMYRKDLKYRNGLAFFIYFTTLFNGGLASYYITLSSTYHLKNTLWVLLFVPMFSAMNILILRNFIRGSIPDSLCESAKIDGAGDFSIFIRIIIPLSKPALASIGLFTALGYWNDWWTPMMFVERQRLFPLQYVLYTIISSVNVSSSVVQNASSVTMPQESLKLAMTVVSTGPILLAYPFVQKYFVKGITLGSVKG